MRHVERMEERNECDAVQQKPDTYPHHPPVAFLPHQVILDLGKKQIRLITSLSVSDSENRPSQLGGFLLGSLREDAI